MADRSADIQLVRGLVPLADKAWNLVELAQLFEPTPILPVSDDLEAMPP